MFSRVQIDKEIRNRVLDETHTVYVPREEVSEYVSLLRRTWPKTPISYRNIA